MASKKPNLDSVTTINEDGSHYKLQPSRVQGRFTLARRVVAMLLVGVFVALPWVKVAGMPAVFLDVAHREFHVFGLNFDVQDLWLLFFCISGLGFTLFFITSLLGRIWCGWVCPYTVFLDHFYRGVERLIEGDAPSRRKLDKMGWSIEKIIKRGSVHLVFLFFSLIISLVFLSYFVSVAGLLRVLREGIAAHSLAFGVLGFLTMVLYFCFSWFREQFCVVMCPYGRLQSALSDDQTMVIGYDFKRGEPRGRATNPNNGDCVNCLRCVQVCPTGIDIRNGLQLECIGCAACVDACDEMMRKLSRPTGLVRYSSHSILNGAKRQVFRPRIIAYLLFLLLGACVFGFTLTQKLHPFNVQVNKMHGAPFNQTMQEVSNVYQIHLSNKRNTPSIFTFHLENTPYQVSMRGLQKHITLPARSKQTYMITLVVAAEHYKGSFDCQLVVKSLLDGDAVTNKLRFLGPSPRLYAKRVKQARERASSPQEIFLKKERNKKE